MSDLLRSCLYTLRVFGPCSNAEVARRLRLPLHRTYRAIQQLEQRGLVVHPKLQAWDVSDRGREWFRRAAPRKLGLFEGDA